MCGRHNEDTWVCCVFFRHELDPDEENLINFFSYLLEHGVTE